MRRVSVASLLVAGCAFLLTWQPTCAQEELRIETNCAGYVLPENREMGFSAEDDPSCLTDNTQCFAQTCRLCKDVDNGHTKHYTYCDEIKSKRDSTQSSASTKDSSSKKKNSKLKSVEAAMASPTGADCASRVSPGDQSAGITAIFDASCASGGLGCQADSCKFCRTSPASASQTYKLCSELTGGAATSTTTSTTTSGCAAAVAVSGMQDVSFVNEPQCQRNAQLAGCVAASSCRLCRNAKNEGNQFLVSCKVLREQTTPVTTVMSSAGTEPSSLKKDDGGLDGTSLGLGAALGFALAMAAVAIKTTKTRRIADAVSGDQLHRVDSIFQNVGRDRIAQL
ncbi:hypothetical protein Gpo141_00009555 [Globisporangium polare]